MATDTPLEKLHFVHADRGQDFLDAMTKDFRRHGKLNNETFVTEIIKKGIRIQSFGRITG